MKDERQGGGGKLWIDHVHHLIRLLAEAREIPAWRSERAQHLMSGVARIVGAAIAEAVLEVEAAPDGDDPHCTSAAVGWETAARGCPAVLTHWMSTFRSTVRAVMRTTPSQPGAAVTATWAEIIADPRCSDSVCAEQGLVLNAVFSSLRLTAPSRVHGLGLYREPGTRPFSEEERNLVNVFHTACGSLLNTSLHEAEAYASPRARLSPRQRQTLELVLSGLCDKDIAERLGISRYTVNQYTKAIYRHYAVTSRAQLLARLLVSPLPGTSLIVGTGNVAIVP